MEGSAPKWGKGRIMLWRDLISSQLDADRADYLLRDAYHCGVAYGKYDLDRLLVTLTIGCDPETQTPILAVREGGIHVAEALIIARYQMFTQVYFQHTRRAYDFHAEHLLKAVLQQSSEDKKTETFPPPTSVENLRSYVSWDDWKVLGMVSEGQAGEHGESLRCRRHYRRVHETSEVPSAEEIMRTENVANLLQKHNIRYFQDNAQSQWYKLGKNDIAICRDKGTRKCEVLSTLSSVVKGLQAVSQQRIYVHPEDREKAKKLVEGV